MASKFELESKIEGKSFGLSVDEDMTSGTFIILGTVSIQHLIGDLPEPSGSNLFVFNLGLDCLCIARLCIF